ncbi:MAG: SUMF1/EgtB/PvdO family nonheme iron enzyme [Chloroflexi bacterium]|nr:SUMF1/EgtB/PvdO family nonheme iron enzyme [Chloroflexota bacterium]
MDEELRQKIEALEGQRDLLGDAAVDAALAALRQEAPLTAASRERPQPIVGQGRAFSQMAAAQNGDDAWRGALVAYLEYILTNFRALNLRGIRAEQALTIELEQVYISLTTADPAREAHKQTPDTARRAAQEAQSEPVQRLLAEHPRLVVVGDPGCGKTTLLRYLALTCARAIAEDNAQLVTGRLGLRPQVIPLPIFLPLREFAAYVRQVEPGRRVGGGAPTLLLEYLHGYFQRWQLQLPDDFFLRLLEEGDCLVLLDGLDEVADFDERVIVSEHVTDFVRRFGRNRFVLSSRVRGYTGAAKLGDGFFACRVLDFDEDDIAQFVTNWTLAVEASAAGGRATPGARAEAARQAADLQEAVLTNPRVRDLAVNPLLLTVVAMVHRYRAKLPENRAELYNECTEVLLGHWDRARPGEEGKQLAYFTGTDLRMDPAEKRAFIEPIAYAMHQQGVKEWDKSDLLTHLQGQFTERGQPEAKARRMAERFLEALALRSGLLQEAALGVYQFLHLTFQEYLAARYLADQDDFAALAAARVGDGWWKETLLLTAGHLGSMGRRRVALLLEELQDAAADPEAGLLLAGECLVDLGDGKVTAVTWQQTKAKIAALIAPEGGAGDPERRHSAGLILGRLGDEREGVYTLPPLLTAVIRGPFLFGDDGKEEREAAPFRAGVYPITNGQYRQFMEAGGYREERWWSKKGWQWRQGEPQLPWQKTDQPDYWLNRRFNADNQPVVGVTWYEAEAFCRWLSDADGSEYRLPTEEEREHLARGPKGRTYPWGNDWETGRANTKEMGWEQTSAVGIFTNGTSPYGVHDCAGNVWEWCVDWTDKRKLFKSIKGGSWAWEKEAALCGAHDDDFPVNSSYNLGFRVVAPIS